jgi:hypothetical protein
MRRCSEKLTHRVVLYRQKGPIASDSRQISSGAVRRQQCENAGRVVEGQVVAQSLEEGVPSLRLRERSSTEKG